MRLSACFGVSLHIIEPAGFHIDDKRVNRVAMDYIQHLKLQKHSSWDAFHSWAINESRRIILATTKSKVSYLNFNFRKDDILLFGRESSGVPDNVHIICDNRIKIFMQNEIRSFNVANSCAIILSEAIRQINC
jgi:tRNA (cytidine/uridine-2'-O-)-methyltransferase